MVYIDTDFKCHTDNPNGEYRAIDKELFPGKCQTYIEGYRYVPDGESWTRSDGVEFQGEMIAPWKDYTELDAAQREYERALIADMQNALNKLGVTLDE